MCFCLIRSSTAHKHHSRLRMILTLWFKNLSVSLYRKKFWKVLVYHKIQVISLFDYCGEKLHMWIRISDYSRCKAPFQPRWDSPAANNKHLSRRSSRRRCCTGIMWVFRVLWESGRCWRPTHDSTLWFPRQTAFRCTEPAEFCPRFWFAPAWPWRAAQAHSPASGGSGWADSPLS